MLIDFGKNVAPSQRDATLSDEEKREVVFENAKTDIEEILNLQMAYFPRKRSDDFKTLWYYRGKGGYYICVKRHPQFVCLTGKGIKKDDKKRQIGYVGPFEKGEVVPAFEKIKAALKAGKLDAQVEDALERCRHKKPDGDDDSPAAIALPGPQGAEAA